MTAEPDARGLEPGDAAFAVGFGTAVIATCMAAVAAAGAGIALALHMLEVITADTRQAWNDITMWIGYAGVGLVLLISLPFMAAYWRATRKDTP